MNIAIELNGNFRLKLKPESAIEETFLEAMADLSEKGATTVLVLPKEGEVAFVLEVARR